MKINIKFKNGHGKNVVLEGRCECNMYLNQDTYNWVHERKWLLKNYPKKIPFDRLITGELDNYNLFKSLLPEVHGDVEVFDHKIRHRCIYFYCSEEYGEEYEVHFWYDDKVGKWKISYILVWDPDDDDNYIDELNGRRKRWTVEVKY